MGARPQRSSSDHAAKRVEDFYLQNHTHQTLDFVRGKKRDYLALNRRRMTVFEALGDDQGRSQALPLVG